MSRSLELPDPIYDALVEVASASGVAPADWIASRLPFVAAPARSGNEGSSPMNRLLRHAGAVSLGHGTGTDNDAIDADLAREYGDPHGETP